MRLAILLFSWVSVFAQALPFPGPGGPSGCGIGFTTNLAAWFKADVGLTCTGGCSTGNAVTAWADQSGNANNLTAVNAGTFQSAAINSLPAVQMARASSQSYNLGSTIATGDYTIFAVAKTTNSAKGSTLISGASGSMDYYLATVTNNEQGADVSQTAGIATGNAARDTNFHQVNIRWKNSTKDLIFRIDRTDDGTHLGTSTALTTGLTQVGRNDGSGEYLTGQIAELIVYTADIGTTNRTTVETYLNCRYGL